MKGDMLFEIFAFDYYSYTQVDTHPTLVCTPRLFSWYFKAPACIENAFVD
jgi:hypothetical protein